MPGSAAASPAQYGGEIARPTRDWLTAVLRGARQTCPACGIGRLYDGYLKTRAHCPKCGEALHHHRADDAPPYFTIFVVGHIIIGLVLALEKTYHPAEWVHLALFLPLTVVLSLYLLPRIKGALIGLQWGLFMHGFDPNGSGDEDEPIGPAR